MSFVYPNFLWALLLLIVPIIIHLFNFRKYKTVFFSKVSFLTEIVEDSKSGNRLKELLVLLSRLFIVICLVLAFAQPFIPLTGQKNTENITSIYIDNSFSMQAQGQDGDLLNEVKNKAIDLVKSFDENEKINLLTTELLAKDQRFYTKSEIIDRIKEIDLSPVSNQLSTVLNLQADILNKTKDKVNKRVFLFSDFQKSTSKLEKFNKDEIPLFYYQPKAEIKGNIYIDSVWFESPVQRINSPIEVFFRVVNLTQKEVSDLPITLSINSQEKGWKKINVPPNSYNIASIAFTNTKAGLKKGKLHIETNQLFFDDDFYFTYRINDHINILLIKEGEQSKNIEQLYSLSNFYNYKSVDINQVKQEDFINKQLIILQNCNQLPSGVKDKLTESLKNGSTVCLIPGDRADKNAWNNFLNLHKLPNLITSFSPNADLNYFNSEDPLFYGVFETTPKNYKYAKIFKTYNLNITSTHNFISVFNYNSTEPFLYYAKKKNGRIFFQTSPLLSDWTNFQNHALFGVTFLRMAETSTLEKKMYFILGESDTYALHQSVDEKQQIHLINKKRKVDLIPMLVNVTISRELVFDQIEHQIKQAGFYTLTNSIDFNDDIAFNYSRAESKTKVMQPKDILSNFENINWNHTQSLSINAKGQIEVATIKAKEYWRVLLWLALLFLAVETLLLRFWR
ncbi:MAG TPA: hypothetical protein EYG85_05370 [Crocinitomix sp.]|nr:hypothetical protein [Crocinitomix sp.]